MNDFITWLAALAPEGETMLFVRQKPNKKGGYSYVAHLPERARISAGEAWYGNTGSFILTRLAERMSAARENIERVAVLVLDDVGTKSRRPEGLTPTWRMETSPGNEQWGFVFALDDQPTKAEYAAAIEAIAEAGYTDPGACNAVRNFRLPGSVNLKPGRDGFASRLIEWTPAFEFSLPQILGALGVTAKPISATVDAVALDDDGNDDVLAWLNERGLVLERTNTAGWCGVVCPNADAHTNDEIEGRYFPLTRAYRCLHAHCADWDSARFLRWVEGEGGPAHGHGLREELLSQKMAGVMQRLTPTEAFPDEAARVIAEVERREVGRAEQAEWFERFAYLHADDGYFDLVDRRQYSRGNFNAIYRHVACWSVHANAAGKKRRVEASISFDENRQAMGARVLQGVTYAPGESVLVSRAGDVYANLWRNARPTSGGGDPTRWLDLVERLLPDANEREHLLDWMAYKVQHPEQKINHGILLGGSHGIGKDTIFEPFLYAIGGLSKENIALVKNEELNSQWGYSLMSEVLVINELRQAEAHDRRALENRLKPLLAAPPELIPVNRKGLHPFDALNRLSVVAFSNERMAITLPSDDRRWFVLWSDAKPMTIEEGADIWDWLKTGGGRDAGAGYLRARDVSAFAPGGAPPMTEAKAIMLAAGLSAVESALVEMMRQRRGEFALGAAQGPWQALVDRLQASMPIGTKCSVYALFHALREAGWIDLGRVKTADNGNKVHVYAAPDVLDKVRGNKSEIRRMLDANIGAGAVLRAVK